MKSKAQINAKKLELYEARERFSEITQKEKEPNVELASAFYLVERIYTEKISMLNWVLNEDKKCGGGTTEQ